MGLLFALPNLLPKDSLDGLPDWLPHKQISLGLDLQGGSHVLLEVDVDSIIAERLQTIEDDTRTLLRDERIGVRVESSANRQLVMMLRDPADIAAAREALYGYDEDLQLDVADDGRITVLLTDDAVNQRITNATEQAIEILRRRIDESGVREPTIQRQGLDRIIIQLPGVSDFSIIDLDKVAKADISDGRYRDIGRAGPGWKPACEFRAFGTRA